MQRTGPRPAAPPEVAAPAHGGSGGAAQPGWWRRVWQWLMPGPDAELVLAQLNRQLAVLEGARAELEAGWGQGGWGAGSSAGGRPRLGTRHPAAGRRPGPGRRRLP